MLGQDRRRIRGLEQEDDMTPCTKTAPTGYPKLSDAVLLIERFEKGTLQRAEWNHTVHLTIAIWYLAHFEEPQAAERVIDGIRRFNRVHDIQSTRSSGYHETLTLFWLGIARRFLEQAGRSTPTLDLINAFIARYGGRPKLYRDYYSKRHIRSWRARHFWVDPDLKPLV